jgi:two-component system, chemotaxis family, sensor kinase CheA
MARRFERLTRQIASLCRRMGRTEPTVRTSGDLLRLEHDGLHSFWGAMVHAVRNAVDHGIEGPEERQLAGKPEAGVIELGAERFDGRLIFTLRDDGRGIDWERVRREAAERGMPCAIHDDLVRALFVDGLTTRDEVTELSGRGVGLSALREVVEALGGTIAVDSMPGRGTTFRFSFDEHSASATASSAEAAALRNRSTSLLPFLA